MKKNKWLTGLIMTSSALALVGVGFSSWVINNSQATNATVTVNFGKIEDKSLTATLTSTNEELTVRFDALSGDGCDGGVITNGDGQVEKMTFTVKYELKSAVTFTGATISYDFTEYYTGDLGGDNGYLVTTALGDATLTLSNLNQAETTASSNVTTNTTHSATQVTGSSESGYTTTITSTFTIEWGSKFILKNPCKNTLAENSDLVSDLNAFKGIYDTLTSKTIALTITPALS